MNNEQREEGDYFVTYRGEPEIATFNKGEWWLTGSEIRRDDCEFDEIRGRVVERPQQQWISCAERLPEIKYVDDSKCINPATKKEIPPLSKSGRVLKKDKNGMVTIGKIDWLGERLVTTAVEWMPIPGE